jgi:putative DNA primase/helicase
MVSLVARVMTPGAKCDTVPILIGSQGAGKSTGLRALMPDSDWFSDSSIDFSRKDAYAQLVGIWLYELGELAGIRRRDVEPIKAFISSRRDRYRPAYGRNVIEQPRQCVFAGSTNEQEVLSDRSGSRRFWPIETAAVDAARIEADRDQLWAEALVWWRTGSQWWLTEVRAAELEEESGAFQAGDPWDQPVRKWIDQRRAPFTITDILSGPLEKEIGRLNRADQMRLAGMLKAIGCTKVRRRVEGVRGWYWLPPGGIEDYD